MSKCVQIYVFAACTTSSYRQEKEWTSRPCTAASAGTNLTHIHSDWPITWGTSSDSTCANKWQVSRDQSVQKVRIFSPRSTACWIEITQGRGGMKCTFKFFLKCGQFHVIAGDTSSSYRQERESTSRPRTASGTNLTHVHSDWPIARGTSSDLLCANKWLSYPSPIFRTASKWMCSNMSDFFHSESQTVGLKLQTWGGGD